jgi:hypothetical protein
LLGQDIPAAWLALYHPYLRNHGLEVLKHQIVADHGSGVVTRAYTDYLGAPDWTLATIVQDEKERHLQTVVLPVLIAVSAYSNVPDEDGTCPP